MTSPPSSTAIAPPDIAHAVFRTMSASDATLERFAWLGDNLALAIWHRQTVEVETIYSEPGHHTLSCYLGGGYRTERGGAPGVYGAPQRLCSLPDWHRSRWMVRDQLRLMHIYFLPEHFTRRAVVELDREPRELTLADRTYFEDAHIAQLCRRLEGMSWDGADAQLQANEITHEALSQLLQTQAATRRQRLRGGLAPALRRRLAEFIDANLAASLTLGMLSQVACMSEYHLARMFRVSFGLPPAAWIAARRMARARLLLKTTALSLQQVADACGYADSSHFSHRFRDATGVAPSRYRAVVGG